MEALRMKAITNAMQQLINLGCVFKVMHEGTVLCDTLPALAAPPVEVGKPRKALLPIYHDKLVAMRAGDFMEFPLPEGVKMSSWQGSIGGACCRLFGNGKGITEINTERSAVNVLRVE